MNQEGRKNKDLNWKKGKRKNWERKKAPHKLLMFQRSVREREKERESDSERERKEGRTEKLKYRNEDIIFLKELRINWEKWKKEIKKWKEKYIKNQDRMEKE